MDSLFFGAVVWGAPALFAIAGFMQQSICKNDVARWRIAKVAALAALALSLFSLYLSFSLFGQGLVPSVMMLLITALASVLCWFSATYLNGIRGQDRFLSAFLFTLASVGVGVVTSNLGILALAWSASSLFLHRLLTFYKERPFAHLAARKKFVVSRIAEVCLVAFLILLYKTLGTLDISEVCSQLASTQTQPLSIHLAGVFLALAVILKTAQLPLQGWILQVMESPTPVSALLHAGVVNIGGYVLIRMAVLISAIPAAQFLLVGFGCASAVGAGLVAMTRVSVKVRLAWSTCAQMGFMLVECGLGFYGLALVHLVAHSLYKAHAFLSCGETVRKASILQLTRTPNRVSMRVTSFAAGIGVAVTVTLAFVWNALQSNPQLHSSILIITGLALTPLVLSAFEGSLKNAFVPLVQALFIASATVFLHVETLRFFPIHTSNTSLHQGLVAIVVAAFVTLFVVQSVLKLWPNGHMSRILYPWIYGGFFVDEIFTRVVDSLWTPRRKISANRKIFEGTQAKIPVSGES